MRSARLPRERSADTRSGVLARQVGRWGVGALVVGSALGLGTVHTSTLCAVSIVAAGMFAVLTFRQPPLVLRPPARIIAAVGLVLVGWTFLQQVPLPAGVLATLAPSNADIWSRALSPLGEEGPALAAISLDPTATRVQLLRGVLYLLTFLCALRAASRSDGTKFLERALLASATVAAIAAVVHPLLGFRRVFGVYTPESADFGTRVAPLLNTNHLSAYLNIGSCIALGWALARDSRVPRALPILLYVLLVGTQLWLASRAGVAAVLVGSALVTWLVHRSGRGRGVPWRFVAAGVVVLVAVATAVLGSRDQSLADLTSTDTIKIDLIRQATTTLGPFLWLGMGRGSFESVFNAFRNDDSGHIVITNPENIILQWCTEWGVPVGLIALGALAYALRPGAALVRSSVPAGPAAALLALTLHNLLDFSLEIPAVAMAAAVCAACVVGGRADANRDEDAPRWARHPRVLAVASLAVAVGTALAVARGIPGELHADQARLRAIAVDHAIDRDAFHREARAAMLRHPAEPYLPLMGAVRAARVRDESPIPWLARALERATVYGRAHLLLARHLGARFAAQARLEYRLAMEQDYNLTATAIAEGARLVRTGDDALQLVPQGHRAEGVMIALAEQLRARVPEAADRLITEVAARNPRSTAVAHHAAAKSLKALRDGDPRCTADRAACVRVALDNAQRLVDVAATDCAAQRLAAEIRIAAGEAATGIDALEAAVGSLRDPSACLELLVAHAEATGDEEQVTKELQRLLTLGCDSDDRCAAAHIHAAAVEERRKRPAAAVKILKRAHSRMPSRIDVLAVLARSSASAGLHAEALRAYKKLASSEPANAEWRAGVAQQQEAVDRSRAGLLGAEP